MTNEHSFSWYNSVIPSVSAWFTVVFLRVKMDALRFYISYYINPFLVFTPLSVLSNYISLYVNAADYGQ